MGADSNDGLGGKAKVQLLKKPSRIKIIKAKDCRPILFGGYAIKGVVPAKGMALIYGPPGCGKTFTAIGMFMAPVLGIEWRCRKTKPLKVLYIAPDGGAFVQNRIVAYMRHHGIEGKDIDFAIITQPIDILGLTSDQDIDELRGTIAAFVASDDGFEPDAIIIDTVSRSMPGGNENAPEVMTKWIARAQSIAPDKLLVGIHHTGKDKTKGGRGHSSLNGADDCEIEIDDGIITVRKLRDGPKGARFGFRLRVVELGFDEDGDPVTSCVEEEAELPAESGELSIEAIIILRTLRQSYPGAGNPSTTLGRKEINTVIDEVVGNGLIEKAGNNPGAVEKAKKTLRARRNRHFNELRDVGYVTQTPGSPVFTVRFLAEEEPEE